MMIISRSPVWLARSRLPANPTLHLLMVRVILGSAKVANDLDRVVGAGIVGDEDFEVGVRLPQNALDRTADELAVVVVRNANREFHTLILWLIFRLSCSGARHCLGVNGLHVLRAPFEREFGRSSLSARLTQTKPEFGIANESFDMSGHFSR